MRYFVACLAVCLVCIGVTAWCVLDVYAQDRTIPPAQALQLLDQTISRIKLVDNGNGQLVGLSLNEFMILKDGLESLQTAVTRTEALEAENLDLRSRLEMYESPEKGNSDGRAEQPTER